MHIASTSAVSRWRRRVSEAAAATVTGLLLLRGVRADTSLASQAWGHYIPVSELNHTEVSKLAESLFSLELHRYRFIYDTAQKDRFGPLPFEARDGLPDSVQVVRGQKLQAFRPTQGGTMMDAACVVNEILVLDTSTFFMYSLLGTKNLIARVRGGMSMVDAHLSDIWSWRQSHDTLLREGPGLADLRLMRMGAEAAVTGLREQLEGVVAMTEQRQREWETWLAKRALLAEARCEAQETMFLVPARARSEEMAERARGARQRALEGEARLVGETNERVLQARWDTEQAKVLAKAATELAAMRSAVEQEVHFERLNEEVVLKRIAVKGEEDRQYLRDVLHLLSERTFDAVRALTSGDRPGRGLSVALGFLALCLGILAARDVVVVSRAAIESRYSRPRLIRKGRAEVRREKRGRTRRTAAATEAAQPSGLRLFDDMVLGEGVRRRLVDEVRGIRQARAEGMPLRNLLIYGPSGNGKSMAVQRLAQASSMDYAIVNGSDFGPWGKMAATETHKLFLWARSSRRGVMIIIEEAEAVLGDRTTGDGSEWRSSLLNTILCYSGQQCQQYMLVLVTNRASDLDAAVLDRMDTILDIAPPGLRERARLLMAFLRRYTRSTVCISESVLEELARQTEGLSCREVEKLIIGVHGEYLSSDESHPPEGGRVAFTTEWWGSALLNEAAKLRRHKEEVRDDDGSVTAAGVLNQRA